MIGGTRCFFVLGCSGCTCDDGASSSSLRMSYALLSDTWGAYSGFARWPILWKRDSEYVQPPRRATFLFRGAISGCRAPRRLRNLTEMFLFWCFSLSEDKLYRTITEHVRTGRRLRVICLFWVLMYTLFLLWVKMHKLFLRMVMIYKRFQLLSVRLCLPTLRFWCKLHAFPIHLFLNSFVWMVWPVVLL